MENTEILKLPYIMPSQAQKHVTHNEAIRQLDALLQLSVISMDVSAPPSAPFAGARYIIGENASGDWLGLEGHVAAYLDGNWTMFEPLEGWLAHVEDQGIVVLRSNAIWQDFPAPKTLQNMESVGIGASADAATKFSVAAAASLFSHSGDSHRLKINKLDENQTASVVFQSNWMGHAEFGLTGSNDFQVKVSEDGSDFQTAMQIDKASGQVQFPLGAQTTTRIDCSGAWLAYKSLSWVTFSSTHAISQGNYRNLAGEASEPIFEATQSGPLLRQGSNILSFLTAIRSNDDGPTACNMRLVFRYGPSGQEWTDTNIQTDVLFTENDIAMKTNSFSFIDEQLADYECPADGFLLMFVQPASDIAGTRYIYASTSIEVVAA